VNLRKIQFVMHPTDSSWLRDTGPIFVQKAAEGRRKAETAIVHFHFNGWARSIAWDQDTKIPETAARLLRTSTRWRSTRRARPVRWPNWPARARSQRAPSHRE